jgi:hypothetical protein
VPVTTGEASFSSGNSVSTDAGPHATHPSFSSPGIDDGGPEGVIFEEGPVVHEDADANAPFTTAFPSWDPAFTDLTPWPWLHENIFLSGDHSGIFGGPAVPDFTFSADMFSEAPLVALHEPTLHHGDALEGSSTRLDAVLPVTATISGGLISHPAASKSQTLPTSTTTAPRLATQGTGAPEPLSPPIDGPSCTAPPQADVRTLKQRAVDDLILLAVQGGYGDGQPRTNPLALWAQAPSNLPSAFGLSAGPGLDTNADILAHFVKLYKDHFHQLWPLLPRRNLNSGDMHPLLYLTLASIGAMYMGRAGSDCGSFLHNAVRRRVVLPAELDESDDHLVWLAQARLLTQVAALYFGQPRGFSYAQHLGTLLTAQARRMCLFSAEYHHQRVSHFNRSKDVANDAERLDLWLAIEERRRLAFGVFRGDTFTSVLFNTKPLVTLDEIGLEFPSCNAVYNGEGVDPRVALEMIEHDRALSRDLRASDVYHILLERNEMLPPLEPMAHEILLFGLQLLVWRFSRDRQVLKGLTGSHGFEDEFNPEVIHNALEEIAGPPLKKQRRETVTSESESLDVRSYQMNDLITERRRLAAALSKWERALPLAKTFARTEEDRSYVLSSLILYHLSLLRLYAPVEDIHQIHYRLADNRPVSTELIAGVQAWTQSPQARTAVERVRSVWSLITQETQLVRARSRFNFNAYVGLHHGGAILWAYNGARLNEPDEEVARIDPGGAGSSPNFPLHTDKAGNKKVLETFVKLFHSMSPAQWSSFAEVTTTLSTLDFPTSALDQIGVRMTEQANPA